jgi:uncharacterized protein (TIGR00725 family)
MTRGLAIFGSSATEPGSPEWLDAENAGRRCAEAGFAVVTGGYGGTMEAACRGANLASGEAIGVTAPSLFSTRSGANPYVTREIEAETLPERIGILTSLAGGAIVLPGSIGTAAELVVAWNLNHVGRRNGGKRFPTVAVGSAWLQFCELLTGALGAFEEDVHTVETAGAGIDWLLAQPEVSGGV